MVDNKNLISIFCNNDLARSLLNKQCEEMRWTIKGERAITEGWKLYYIGGDSVGLLMSP